MRSTPSDGIAHQDSLTKISTPDVLIIDDFLTVAADSIVNRLANSARTIRLGQIDMRRQRNQQAHAADDFWE